MGLLDNFSFDNLDDPKNMGLLAMGLSMLQSKPYKTSLLGNIGESGMQGLQTFAKAKVDERANRQNDLQQLSGAYNLLKQQEFGKMLAAKQNGQPYSPNPMLPQMETRLGQLAGLGNLSGKSGASVAPPVPAPPQGPPSAPAMLPQGMAPPSQSPMADPNYQPPMARSQPQAPQPQGNLGGPAGGIPMEAWLAQDPTGASYMKQLAEDNKPIALRQGDLVRRNPDGTYSSAFQQPLSVPGVLPTRDQNGQVTSYRAGPGFADAASSIKGAETSAAEGAKAPYSFQNIESASGAKVPMSIAQLMGGRSPPGPASQPIPQSVIDAGRSGRPFNATQAPGGPVVFGQPKQDFFSDIPRSPQPQGIGQSTQAKTVAEELGKAYGETAKSLAADANSANQRMAYNAAALKVLPSSVTGPGAAGISQVKNFLVSRFGIPESVFSEGPSSTQELNKALINAATQKAKSIYGARLAQQEVMMQVNQASPALGMTKAAIKTLLDMDNQLSQYSIEKANDFGEYYARGGNPLLFDGWYAKKKPLSAEIDSEPAPAAPSSAMPKVGEVRKGYAYKGGDPASPASWSKQ